MRNFLNNLRGSVRPVLSYLFALTFLVLAIYSFFKFGNETLAQTILAGFISIVGVVIGIWFQSRNRSNPPSSSSR